MNVEVALEYVCPDSRCVIVGSPQNREEYEKAVTWLDARPQPTWEELVASYPAAVAAQAEMTPEIVNPETIIASLAAMTTQQKAALRAALGL